MIYTDIVDGRWVRAGMLGKGRIDLGSRRALIVPAASLLIKDGRHYVATVSKVADGAMVSLVSVTVGRYSADQAEITRGLSPNDRIVGQGAGLLSYGDRVQVVQTASRE